MAKRRVRGCAALILVALAAMVVAGEVGAQPVVETTEEPAPVVDTSGDEVALKEPSADDESKAASTSPALDPAPSPPAPRRSCRGTKACSNMGQCALEDGQCVAQSDADCQAAQVCRIGRCTARDGKCVAGSDADCQHSQACREEGWCAAHDGKCAATKSVHCAKSLACLEQNRCLLHAGAGYCAATAQPKANACEGERYRSPGSIAFGALSFVVGGSLAIGGTVILANRDDPDCAESNRMFACSDPLDDIFGGAFLGVGGVLVLISIPALIYGAKTVPDCDEDGTAVAPSVRFGPTGGSLTWRW